MPRQLRREYAGAIYHVMNRGDRREDIFLDDEDRKRFLACLREACQKTEWQVQAYCLMPNHFHLVLETPLRVPLAVWINDGAGNFHEGNLDNFRFQLLHDDPLSLGSSERLLPLLRTGECPRRSAALSSPFHRGPEPARAKLIANRPDRLGTPKHFDIWTRGPPTT